MSVGASAAAPGPDAGIIVGLLADDDRRRVTAALILGATSLDAIATAADLSTDRVSRALGRLVDGGLVTDTPGAGLAVEVDVFQQAARAARARPPSTEHAGESDERRRVLEAFVRDGRITSLPAGRAKRLIVLDWLVQAFEPGVKYPEREVNEILASATRRHGDAAPVPRRRGPARSVGRGVLAQRRHRDVTDQRGHYATLGVQPDATAGEIREAYRALARRYHPDHEPASAATMAAINEAYRVLGEPARRAVYDATLRGTGSAAAMSPRPAYSTATRTTTAPARAPLPPARYPWKLVLVMFLLGSAVVLIGAIIYRPKAPAPPDNLLVPGSCVTIEPNGDAREINCTETAGELVVVSLIGYDQRCPTGSEGHRDRQGRGQACVTTTSVP